MFDELRELRSNEAIRWHQLGAKVPFVHNAIILDNVIILEMIGKIMKQKLYFYDLDTPVSRHEYLFLQSIVPQKRLEELQGKKEAFVREKILGECLARMAACEYFSGERVCERVGEYRLSCGEGAASEELLQNCGTAEASGGPLQRASNRLKEEKSSGERITVTGIIREDVSKEQLSWMRCLDITQEKGGKKYFANCPEIYFNISHSGHRLVCAVSDFPVGVDIEKPADSKDIMKIVKRYFHVKEIERFECLYKEGINPAEEFQRLWTLKEAYLKCTGEGLAGGMDGYRFENGEQDGEYYVGKDTPFGTFQRMPEYQLQQFMDEERYITTICVKTGLPL